MRFFKFSSSFFILKKEKKIFFSFYFLEGGGGIFWYRKNILLLLFLSGRRKKIFSFSYSLDVEGRGSFEIDKIFFFFSYPPEEEKKEYFLLFIILRGGGVFGEKENIFFLTFSGGRGRVFWYWKITLLFFVSGKRKKIFSSFYSLEEGGVFDI